MYRITYEDEGEREKTHILNPDAAIFVPAYQGPKNDIGALASVATVTSQAQGVQSMQQDPPVRRNARIAIRRARAAKQHAIKASSWMVASRIQSLTKLMRATQQLMQRGLRQTTLSVSKKKN